ncbi:MAG: hypothetical protein K8R36_02230, partial [Planctomycetales bacterium]|nr:hypothetical protein [Planctomycetales bacterium]
MISDSSNLKSAICNLQLPLLSRRDMLSRCGTGIGMLGLATLFADEGLLAVEEKNSAVASPLAPKQPHFPAKA